MINKRAFFLLILLLAFIGFAACGSDNYFYLASDKPSNLWVKDASNPILSPGTSGEWDDTFVISPSVIYNGTSYQMWYAGYDGAVMRIGYATSTDGVVWTKYPSNPVFNTGSGWDGSGVSSPSVVYDGITYHMWYSGNNGAEWKIGYATSPDGINWTRYPFNPVLDVGTSGEWDDSYLDHPHVVYTGTGFKMWYSGDGGSLYRVGYATSPDGVNWTKHPSNPVLDVGTSGEWDDNQILPGGVVYVGNTYHMWFTADDGLNTRIGYATSGDGGVWTKAPFNPVLNISSNGRWDDYTTGYPSVIYNGTGFEMLYVGHDGSTTYKIGRATAD